MLVPLLAALALQVPIGPSSATSSDSVALARARDHGDSARVLRRIARRVPVTAEHERTAFRDPLARELLLAARAARVRQDSTLTSYDATAYQRLSVGMGFRQIGRDRLFLRSETATRVRWSRDVGAWVDVIGRRAVFPMVREAEGEMDMDDAAPLPYYPGRETLWIGTGMVKADVDPTEFVHPLARGSEAYYHYATGDSLRLELGNGRSVRLRELRITARKPEWNLVVGSFWFDVASGQLVRAAYRISVPMDIWKVATTEDPQAMDDVPALVKPMITPMVANVDAITVEYGLFNGFWMPRLQALDASARVSFMRVPVRLEERFKYANVNALDTTLSPINLSERRRRRYGTLSVAVRDSLHAADSAARADANDIRDDMEVSVGFRLGSSDRSNDAQRDSIREEIRERVREMRELPRPERDSAVARYRRDLAGGMRDSLRQALLASRRLRKLQCDTSAYRVSTFTRFDGAVKIAQRVPCDESTLATSPELPPSIYEAGEELFGTRERDELVKALGLGLQAGWGPRRPQLHYGLADGVFRYNRVEGLSLGIGADMALGMGYTAHGKARYALASGRPFAEIGFSRSNGRRTISVTGFRRLAVADDWGSPLSFGGALASMLYARDEGFYYHALGGEIIWQHGLTGALQWRAFAERQTSAPVATRWSLFGGAHDSRFPGSFLAAESDFAGVEARARRTFGLDPDRLRLSTDIRAELATARDDRYARIAADLDFTRPITRSLSAHLGAYGGTSIGALTAQRMWRLGGLQTVRGQLAGTHVGDAFWLAHLELGTRSTGLKPVLFYDAGWAGERSTFARSNKPISGAGVGFSALDGLLRFDLARGIYPGRKLRADFYVEARF